MDKPKDRFILASCSALPSQRETQMDWHSFMAIGVQNIALIRQMIYGLVQVSSESPEDPRQAVPAR